MKRSAVVVLSAAATCALAFVAGASATTADIHNPGFETAAPFEWSGVGTGGISRDTSRSHSGQATMKLDAVGGGFGAQSNCFTFPAGTAYYLGFWYATETASGNVAAESVNGRVDWFGMANCGGAPLSQPNMTVAATADGAFHFVQVTGTSHGSAVSGLVQLTANCSSSGSGDCNAWFDDVSLDTAAPTAAAVSSFAAQWSHAGADLSWRAPSTAGALGFNVWRGGTKLNRSLIPALSKSYRFRDAAARPGVRYVYRLQLIGLDGARRWVGTAALRAAPA